jgi:hypothetical protein
MIAFVGGPMDGEHLPSDLFDFDEVHIQNKEQDPVYIYYKDEETGNYYYEGEFLSSDIEYEEDEDEE